jgi:enhancing lycopene biosynthesis protein 2
VFSYVQSFISDFFVCVLISTDYPFPSSGGFGVAKNLSDWAVKGKDYTVQPQVEKVIKAFRQAGKPLAMCCISPVLAAKALPGCEITVGQDKECEKYVSLCFTRRHVCYCQSMFRSNHRASRGERH